MAGQAKKWHNKYKFLVEIDGFISAGFQKAGPLEAEVEVIEHLEGGARSANKSPGQVSYSNITLERGATQNDDEYTWFSQVVNATDGSGGADPANYERNLAIIEQDNNGREVKRWNVFGAWPNKFVAGEWDNTSNEKTIRSLELVVDHWVRA